MLDAIFQENLNKANGCTQNVAERFRMANNSTFYALPFRFLESRRTRDRQRLLLTQGRTLNDIMVNAAYYHATKDDLNAFLTIYQNKKNLTGQIVTWTMDSQHLLGLAIDVQPIIPPSHYSRSKELDCLASLAAFWNKYGIYRPTATMSQGDYGHFEAFDFKIAVQPDTIVQKILDYMRYNRLVRLQKSITS